MYASQFGAECEAGCTMAWRSRILLTTLTLLWAAAEKADLHLEEGSPCPFMEQYPSSRCMKTCPTIEAYFIQKILKREDTVDCNVAQGLICCPNRPPQEPRHLSKMARDLPASSGHNPGKYHYLAALRFLKAGTLDSHIYRCTAVLVRPNFVLTSALCGGSPSHSEKSPNRARIGLVEPYKGQVEITNFYNYKENNDLFLLRLWDNVSNVDVAPICSPQQFPSARRLVAVGFSQLEDKNCGSFEMEVSLRRFDLCSVQINDSIKGIEGNTTHFCVQPINPLKAEPGECIQCLRGSASVLHAVLPDGRLCVAGVATPTSGNCHNSGSRLLYTSLLNQEVRDFISGSH